MDPLPSLDDVRAAAVRIRPYIRTTPIVSDGDLAFKLEFLQPTGSFKVRGAFNAALKLDEARRERGIVAVSGGNHGLAVAYAGRELHIPATVFMPESTPAFVCDRARGFGATVRLTQTIADSIECARAAASEDGLTFFHPFDDGDVIAGQGTIGLEILESFPPFAA